MSIILFESEVAKEHGIIPAIVLEQILSKIHNVPTDGKYITCLIYELEQTDLLTYSQVKRAVKVLEDAGYIQRTAYKKHRVDRNLWYEIKEDTIKKFRGR